MPPRARVKSDGASSRPGRKRTAKLTEPPLRQVLSVAPAPRRRVPGVLTLFGLPLHDDPAVAPKVDVLISGVPSDGGGVFRPGARFGPRAVRDLAALARPFSSALGVDVFDELSGADGGDLKPRTSSVPDVLEAVAVRAALAQSAGVIPGFVGGDRTITLGALRGLRRAKHRASGLLLLSAEPGAAEPNGGDVRTNNFLRHALKEGLVRVDSSLHVGLRGPFSSARDLSHGFSSGIETAGTDEVRWDLHSVVSQIRRLVMKGAIYVSIDLGVLDPAFAPGVSMPSPGGLSTWELQQILRALVGAEILGFDVVELCPPYDAAGVTGLAAQGAIHEILAAIADTRRSARPAPSTRRTGRAGRRSA